MEAINRKTQSMLSLCQRAGRLVSGDDTVLADIKNGKALLVIIAGDASENTRKKFTDKCSFYDVPYIVASNKAELNGCIGKYNRAVFAVIDENFAKQIKSGLQSAEQEY